MYHSFIATPNIYNHDTNHQLSFSPRASHPTSASYHSPSYNNLNTSDIKLDKNFCLNKAPLPGERPMLNTINGLNNFNHPPHKTHENTLEKPLFKTIKHSNSLHYKNGNSPLLNFESAPIINGNTKLMFSDPLSKKTYEQNNLPADKSSFG
jgi:hypothetical protein